MIVNHVIAEESETAVTLVLVSQEEALMLALSLLEQVKLHPNVGRRELFDGKQYFSIEVLAPGRTTKDVREALA